MSIEHEFRTTEEWINFAKSNKLDNAINYIINIKTSYVVAEIYNNEVNTLTAKSIKSLRYTHNLSIDDKKQIELYLKYPRNLRLLTINI